ncbi:hypothetical protein EMCRGX_G016036 [Ephydatia muelleri]
MLKSVRQTGVWPNAIIKYIQGVAPATVTDPGCPKPPLATDNLSCLSKLECPLCCEILSQPIELPCSVLACAECIIAWLKISGTVLCPCCYSDIPMAPASLRPASDLIISLLHDILVHCTSCGRDMRAGAYVGHQCTRSPTRSEPITFMRVVQANSPATTACAKSLNGRCREMHKIRNVISGGEPSALLHKEASSMLSREDKMALIKEAGIVDIGPGEGLQIKAAVSITWSKMRVLRRLLKESGVSLASEVSMRKITDEMIGDNLEGEVAPFSFKMPTGGEEIRGAPLVYVPNLIQKIIQTLEEQDSSARLTWHGGFIPENEIWVKLGGDRGGGIFKATFQIVNVPNPNSVLNTCVFCCFMAGDSTYNLHVALDRYKLQVNKLQGMRWRDFTVKVFLCGDYDFYGKMYGLSGASELGSIVLNALDLGNTTSLYDLKDFTLLLPPGITLSTIGHFAKAIVGADGKVINLCDHVVYTVEKRYSLETGTFCGSFQAEIGTFCVIRDMEPIVDAQQKPVFNNFDCPLLLRTNMHNSSCSCSMSEACSFCCL